MDRNLVTTKEEAIAWIHQLQTLGIKPGLKRMEWLMERLGHPERRLKFVHVAGTNGKGSTVSFISQVLIKAGYQVGTFTSPYLIDFTNRIQINGEDISEEALVEMLNKIIPVAEELAATEWGSPTEFEIITALSLLYYAVIALPDVVIWETGLGGRLDSTNIVIPLVSVITNIGYDHMDLLGQEIREIAREKAGIIKAGVPVVSTIENSTALAVIKETAKANNSALYQLNEQFVANAHKIDGNGSTFSFKDPFLTMPEINIRLLGPHQIKNSAAALMTLEVLRQFYAFAIPEEAVYEGMFGTFWPGRLEIVAEKPAIIIDGAHNPEGAASLKEAISLFKYNRLIMVTGILGDKAIAEFYRIISPIPDILLVTEPDYPRAAKTETVVEVLRSIDEKRKVMVIKDWQEAVNVAVSMANSDDLVVITGSLYLISDVRRHLLATKKEGLAY